MIAVVLEDAGLDPTYVIGGDLNESGSGARTGAGDLFVFEADESDGSFLLIRPEIGLVTNVEVDHVDFYRDGLTEIRSAFRMFSERCGRTVVFGDDPHVGELVALSKQAGWTYGLGAHNDCRLMVEQLGPEGARGILGLQDGQRVPIGLRVDGVHNLLDAAAAIVTAGLLGVDPRKAASTLEGFEGVRRRFELRGSVRGADFFDDYGHTPTEMAVTLEVARRREPKRLIAVVQPHRYSRVSALWRELGASVATADLVIVTDVYGAQQTPIPGVSGQLVVDGVLLADPDADVNYLPHGSEVVEFLAREVRDGDLVITMGCGDVWMLGDSALARIGSEEAS
jgi:UDP-N-acetylmuramate--alanine ligase